MPSSCRTSCPPRTTRTRLAWENSAWQCQYVDQGDDKWVVTDRGTKAVSFRFKETRRNCGFLELLDAGRGDTLRLSKDAPFTKGGNDGLARHEDFTKYYSGRWVK